MHGGCPDDDKWDVEQDAKEDEKGGICSVRRMRQHHLQPSLVVLSVCMKYILRGCRFDTLGQRSAQPSTLT